MKYNINGWVEDKDAIDSVESQVGVFGSTASFLFGSGKGKIVCLHDLCEKAGIEFPFTDQGNVGSCVAAATAGGNDILKIAEIANGEREEFKAQTSPEHIYYVARVVIGKNRIRGDGAVTAYAIQGIAEHGTLAMINHGVIDLSTYSVDRCKRWGTGSGYPKTLDSIAKEHTVGQFTRVKSYEEARDSIANGSPVIVGSKFGFDSETDNEGFCKYSTTWNHCYHPNSWIYGLDTKKIVDSNVGDLIFDHNGHYCEIESVSKRKYSGRMISVKTSFETHNVTEDHVFLVKTGGSELSTRPYVSASFSKDIQNEVVFVSLQRCNLEKDGDHILVHAKDLRNNDTLIMPKICFGRSPIPKFIQSKNAKQIPDITPSDDLAWFFGLYAGDGHAVENHKVVITQNVSETDSADRVKKTIFRCFGLDVKMKKRKDAEAVTLTIYNAALANFMCQWFGKKKNKQFPNWLLSDNWNLEQILLGFIDADGCYVKSTNSKIAQLSNTSEKIIHQLYMIATSLGYSPSGWKIIQNSKSYKEGSINHYLRINFSKKNKSDYSEVVIKNISEFDYNGEVISLEVSDEHTYLCNGASSHNCMFFCAVDDDSKRKGCLCVNSWGRKWLKIRKRKLNQPDGTFWVDAETVDAMLRNGDAWSIADFNGFRKKANMSVIW